VAKENITLNLYSDAEGTALVSYMGNAPFPTVRVAPHKRPPVSKDGYTFRKPRIEELVPLRQFNVDAPSK